MDVPFAQAERYLSKITASQFSTLNMKIANQNMLEKILIAMLNENQADSNENLISLVLVHFGLIKLKPKINTSVFPTYFTC